jgi:hypothetical protein
MPPVVRDTLSLRPQGVYAFAFLAARAAEMVSLIIIIGIVSRTEIPPPPSRSAKGETKQNH